jgi:thiol-disulfide isomerase/thioredoxin
MHKRLFFLLSAIALILAACSSSSTAPPSDAPEPVTYDALMTEITTLGDPTVVNSWASWCPPCRSEAPLLATAAKLNEDVRFVMKGGRVYTEPGRLPGAEPTYSLPTPGR